MVNNDYTMSFLILWAIVTEAVNGFRSHLNFLVYVVFPGPRRPTRWAWVGNAASSNILSTRDIVNPLSPRDTVATSIHST